MRSLFSSAPQQASAPEQASAPAAAVPPSEHESEAGPEFDAVRLRRLRDFLQETDVENRLASCVEQMLSGEELPWNPYPSLLRLLRQEETKMMLWSKPHAAREELHKAMLTTGHHSSELDTHLSILSPHCVAWRSLAPLVDPEAIKTVVGQLASTPLLAPLERTEARESGDLQLKACTALAGAHAFGGRFGTYHPDGVQLREHFQVKGLPSQRDTALRLWESHICAGALAVDASQAHFVRLLEVYEGDDADDADDEGDALGGGAEPAPFAANPRGLPSRFMVGDLRQRPRALTAALRHAAQRQQPAYLHVLVAAPVFESELDPKVAASLPPRWEYLAVQKALFFHFDPLEDDPAAAAAAAEAAAAAAREREEGRGYIGVEEEPEMVSASSALPLESFFQSVFLSEADGAWYLRLKHEDRQGRPHTFSEALGSFEAFLRQQVSRLMMRGDPVPLFEALLLLLLPAGSKQRTPLLEQILVFLRSDACLLAQLAQQCVTLQHVLRCSAATATAEAKRTHAGRVVAHQLKALASRLKQFLARAAWADVRPARRHMATLLEALTDGALQLGADQRPEKAEEHTALLLATVGRKVRALHLVLADAAAGSCALVAEYIGDVWRRTTDVKVPVALQPPPLRERIINVPKELARHKHIHTYPADVAREAVLLQYVVDTRLDETLQRALLGVCSEAALRGNPFHAIIGHVKAAAQRFELVRETDDAFTEHVLNKPFIIDSRLHVARVPRPPHRPSSGEKGAASKDGSRRASKDGFRGGGRQGRSSSIGGGTWGSAAKGLLQRGDTPDEEDDEDEDEDDTGVYGVQGSLLVVSHTALRALAHQLGVLCLPRQSRQEQEFECVAQCCFCGDALLLSHLVPAEQLWSVAVREDHFVRGTDEEGALLVHCQHVMRQLKTLHTQTHHLLASVHLGESKWAADALLFNERLALKEMGSAYRAGGEVRAHAYMLIEGEEGGGEHGRYLALTKDYQLVYHDASASNATHAWPPRATQVFDSVFLSRGHMAACQRAHGDRSIAWHVALGTWRAKKRSELLEARARAAIHAGDALEASRALLLLSFLDGAQPLLPHVGRLLYASAAAHLERLAQLNRAIHGMLECLAVDEQRSKCKHEALSTMFDQYRAQTLEYLTSDACANFEATRYTVQGAFYTVFSRLRVEGLLGGQALAVLTEVDDYLHCVQIAVAIEAVAAMPELEKALRRYGSLDGTGRAGGDAPKLMKGHTVYF